jgi:hypothetical protein
MSTTDELANVHLPAARTRYAEAIAELRAAFGDLAAIERLLMNDGVGYGTVATFGGPRPDPIPLRHPIAAPDVGGSFEDDVRSAYAVRSAEWGTPDPE